MLVGRSALFVFISINNFFVQIVREFFFFFPIGAAEITPTPQKKVAHFWVFALTSTWPYYSIPVWHARPASLPTTLLWFLEKHAACFNGNWIWSGGIFLHQRSTAGLFPVCIQCVSLCDAGPPPGHTFLKHCLLGRMSAALKSAALSAGVGPKSEWERDGGAGGDPRSAGDNSFAAPHTFTTAQLLEQIQPLSKTRQLDDLGIQFSRPAESQ